MLVNQADNRKACGFTFIFVLFAIAFVGASTMVVGTLWSTSSKRINENQLLFVGHQFRNAIESYYRAAPAGAYQFPQSLDDLIEDRRGPTVARHLRRVYNDPITKAPLWELITLGDDVIIGVASLSEAVPLKRAGFTEPDASFEDSDCYCDWRFIFFPQTDQADSRQSVLPRGP